MAIVAPTIVAAVSAGPSGGNSTARSITFPVPGGFQVGDVLIAAISHNGPSSEPDLSAPGFTRIGIAKPSTTVEGRQTGFFAMPIGNTGSVPAEVIFSNADVGDPQQGFYRYVGVLMLVRGADLVSLVGGFSNNYQGTPVTNGVSTLAFSTPVASLVLFLGANEATAGVSATPTALPSGYTVRGSASSNTGTTGTRTVIWVGSRSVAAGSIAGATITWGGVSGPRAHGIAIKGIDPAVPQPGGTGGSTEVIIKVRRGTTAQIAASSKILADGEPGYDKTTKTLKIGNGTATWDQLPSISSSVILVPDINTIPPGTPAGAILFQAD